MRRRENILRTLRRGFVPGLLMLVLAYVPGAHAEAEGPRDPNELETFLDGFFAAAMQQYHAPGLVFVMVKDGEVFLSKGYGYADLRTRRAVDPEKTIFRVASVSKLFTATAVMQLVEQGKLNLRRDVNEYLPNFQLPVAFPKPVTLHHLLTHTAGFDDRFFGMAARRPEDLRPLGLHLAERMPRRALPPGDVFSYSNYGLALAGFLVESVSGESFETYVNENIFEPLDMKRSAFTLPRKLIPDLAQGYFYRNHAYHEAPYDYLQMLAPAGSLHTTGADIARFMLAHLQDGRLGEVRILSEETARRMHEQQFTHHPMLPGYAYGFSEDIVNGRRLIGRGGNWRGFTSRLVLDPEAQLGFFLSYNSLSSAATENGLHLDLVDAFYDRYFPVAHPLDSSPKPDPVAGLDRFEGRYRHNRYTRDSFGKLAALLSESSVTANQEGTLTVRMPGENREPIELTQIEPLVFMRSDGKGYVAFREDAAGNITHMFLHGLGPNAFDKLSRRETARFQIPLISGIAALFLTALFGWPLAYALRKPRPTHPVGARAARWISALTMVLFLGSLTVIAVSLSGDLFEYAYGVPARIAFLLRMYYIVSALALVTLVCAILAWRKRWWNLPARLHYTIVSLASVALIAFLIYWRLLGFGW